LENDPSVNISWSDTNTNWASAAGKATIITDSEKIKPIL
jgi:general stress protein 26